MIESIAWTLGAPERQALRSNAPRFRKRQRISTSFDAPWKRQPYPFALLHSSWVPSETQNTALENLNEGSNRVDAVVGEHFRSPGR